MRTAIRGLLAFALCAVSAPARAQTTHTLADLVANDNRTPAGTVRDGVRTVELRVVRGTWRPDRDHDPGLTMLAFGEVGKPASIPGPLMRVTTGTRLLVRVRNETDSTLVLFGLTGARALTDTALLAAGATREFAVRPAVAGNFFYRAQFRPSDPPLPPRFGEDRTLAGAFIVDAPGARTDDRVLVLNQVVDAERIPTTSANMVEEVLTINGRSWPHTERLSYDLGDTIRWRVLNASYDVHPMHLHGFYFNVRSRGDFERDTVYQPAEVRLSVTERMRPFTTMNMDWVPDRPGNWLFHCHLTFHILPHGRLGPPTVRTVAHEHTENHALMGMAGLVLGTNVRDRAGTPRADVVRTQLRLLVHQRDSVDGHYTRPFGFALHQPGTPEPTAAHLTIPGPPLILRRGEPTAITVVNRTTSTTSVHWHGVELESYYDGVSGFGGTPARVTPAVAPGDSFVVHVTPPRAGTFIYHSHFEELRQQLGGMYGAFIVLDSATTWDAEHDRPIVISNAPYGDIVPLVNGDTAAVIRLRAGETYRFRLINITLEKPNMRVLLVAGDQPVEWELLAKDGADLPASQAGRRRADMFISIGETFDVQFTPERAGPLTLEVRTGAGVLMRSARVLVE